MKKVNLVLLVLIILSILSGVTIADSRNNQMGNNEFFDKGHNKKISHRFKDKSSVELSYSKSKKIKKEDSNKERTLHIFKDSKGSEYYFNDDNKLTRIMYNDPMSTKNKGKKLDFKDIEKTAKEFFDKNIEKKDYKYKNYEYYENLEQYSFEWIKCVNNIETSDFMIININEQGQILSFVNPNSDLYSDEAELIRKSADYIQEKEAQELVDLEIGKMSKNSNLQFNGYNIINSKLYFDENKMLAWEFSVEFQFGDAISIKTIKIDANTKEVM